MKTIIKKVSFLILTAFIAVSCNDGQNAEGQPITTDLIKNPATATGDLNTEEMPMFEFEEESIDFGSILQGEKVNK
ncbi:MAG: hypothetical protein H0X62_09725, partial [Bacteroidetes bacterium]|nr:hypothetical protein [Bacteroidota bacterium]